jgi:uncharacterized protein YsxB (DUF464 family)
MSSSKSHHVVCAVILAMFLSICNNLYALEKQSKKDTKEEGIFLSLDEAISLSLRKKYDYTNRRYE